MTYRDPTRPVPLVLSILGTITAVDPLDGTLIWQLDLENESELQFAGRSVVARMFVVERTLVLVCRATVGFVDLDTGRLRSTLKLAFKPDAGIASGAHVLLSGLDGAACLSANGELRWQAKREQEGVFSNGVLVARDRGGRELWSTKTASAAASDASGIVLGELVAQPDLREG